MAEAEQIYRQILSLDPKHSYSLHLLGMIAFQTGRCEEAVNLIKKAIEIKGNAAAYHSNLGKVFQVARQAVGGRSLLPVGVTAKA